MKKNIKFVLFIFQKVLIKSFKTQLDQEYYMIITWKSFKEFHAPLLLKKNSSYNCVLELYTTFFAVFRNCFIFLLTMQYVKWRIASAWNHLKAYLKINICNIINKKHKKILNIVLICKQHKFYKSSNGHYWYKSVIHNLL